MHVRDDELQLYLLGQLARQKITAIKSHLVECSDCGVRLAEAAALARPSSEIQERRREVRQPTDDPASMQVLSPLDEKRSDIRILDVSKWGMKLSTPERLQVGMVLQIKLKSRFVMGEVRYCTPSGDRFSIGLQIQDLIGG